MTKIESYSKFKAKEHTTLKYEKQSDTIGAVFYYFLSNCRNVSNLKGCSFEVFQIGWYTESTCIIVHWIGNCYAFNDRSCVYVIQQILLIYPNTQLYVERERTMFCNVQHLRPHRVISSFSSRRNIHTLRRGQASTCLCDLKPLPTNKSMEWILICRNWNWTCILAFTDQLRIEISNLTINKHMDRLSILKYMRFRLRVAQSCLALYFAFHQADWMLEIIAFNWRLHDVQIYL